MTEHQELATFAVDVARRAGELIAELRASRSIQQSFKDGGRELVTSADLAANDLITEALQRHTPKAQLFSEEGERQAIDWSEAVWVIDPIDGTVNYVYGHPHVGISLAYVVGGEVQVGVVHAPFQAETFTAVRGQGATCNGQRLTPPPTRPLAQAVIATGLPYDREEIEAIVQRLGRVVKSCRDIRRLAAATIDLCWVAAGRLDASYETLRPWDVAAAGLVAREVGVHMGHYTHAPGEDVPDEINGRDVAFANPELLRELLAVLRGER